MFNLSNFLNSLSRREVEDAVGREYALLLEGFERVARLGDEVVVIDDIDDAVSSASEDEEFDSYIESRLRNIRGGEEISAAYRATLQLYAMHVDQHRFSPNFYVSYSPHSSPRASPLPDNELDRMYNGELEPIDRNVSECLCYNH